MKGWAMGLGVIGWVVASGCLGDSGRRVQEDSTGGGDTHVGDTGAGDTTSADTGTRPDVEVIACGDCDDGDECTFDRCNTSTGECEHLAAPSDPGGAVPAPTCLHDGDCDDLDACTEDVCVTLPGSCGVYQAYCVSTPIVGCSGPCVANEDCSDADPCTQDVCLGDGSCGHWPEADCDPECTRDGLVTIADLRAGTTDQRVKTFGALAPASVDQACNDGPTCDCFGGASLRDAGLELSVTPGAEGDVATGWQCETTGCGTVAVTCTPVAEGVVYRMWGAPQLGVVPFGGDAALPILPPVSGLVVAGYCLDTAPASLAGDYDGRIELTPGVWAEFTLTMTTVDQGVIVAMGPLSCTMAGCPEGSHGFAAQDTVIEEGDGRIGFLFDAPGFSGTVTAHAKLFSNGGRFVGRWEPAAFLPNGVAIAMGGAFELTRLGTGRLPESTARP